MKKSTIALLSTLGLILVLALTFVLVGAFTLRSRLEATSGRSQDRLQAPEGSARLEGPRAPGIASAAWPSASRLRMVRSAAADTPA